jgi:uncharacterized protein DUF6968
MLEYKVATTVGAKEIIARLGFPRPSEKYCGDWACDFQLLGWKYDRVRTAHGIDGLQALTIAAEAIRKALDRKKGLIPGDPPYEFIFPRLVPISYGLKFHRDLCELLDNEIAKKERQIARRWSRRAKRKQRGA